MSPPEALRPGLNDVQLWQQVLAGIESSATILFWDNCGHSVTRWHNRYFPEGNYQTTELTRDLRTWMCANNWFRLRQWDQAISLKQFMEIALIEVCHLKLKESGLCGHLLDFESDWTLRDRLIAGHDDAWKSIRPMYVPRFAYLSKDYSPQGDNGRADLERNLETRLLTKDCHVLWAWQGRASLKTYLTRIIATVFRDEQKTKRKLLLFDQLPEGPDGVQNDGIRGHVKADDMVTRLSLEKAIERLTQPNDQVYFRRILQGEDPMDAGRDLVGPGAYDQFKFRARGRLRTILTEMGFGGEGH